MLRTTLARQGLAHIIMPVGRVSWNRLTKVPQPVTLRY